MMRRFMYRIAQRIAEERGAKVIFTGESVGQVASQTLESMYAINQAISMPVLRPLCCFDKEEIMEIAHKIGTFDISIRPYEDCCTVFLPKSPAIKPRLAVVEKAEQAMWEVGEELMKKAIENVEII